MNKRPKKQTKNKNKSKSTFRCFSCKDEKPRSEIARSGKNAYGIWHLCRECRASYMAEREMDKQAYRAARGDMRVGERGAEQMGWNGVPSEKSLRRRSR